MDTQHNQALLLVGVFDADGGIAGELRYLAGKLRGNAHCALCDITHGLNPLGKKEFKQAAAGLSVPLRLVHRNEMDQATARIAESAELPCIVALQPSGETLLVTREELEVCRGSATKLANLIETKLRSL